MEPAERKRLVWYVILLLLVIGGMVYLDGVRDRQATQAARTGSHAQKPEKKPESIELPHVPVAYPYEQGQASRDGIGKFYLGREISHVMGHTAIHWLERPEREAEEATSRVMQALAQELKPNEVVVDVGSGSGYYSFRLAKLVPEGRVIGIDIQPEMVDYLARKAEQLGVANVESHLGKVDAIQLPQESVDAVLMVDAYHEFSHPNEMMQSIVHALKPTGRIYMLEYRAEDSSVPIKPLHKMSEAQCIREMAEVGLRHIKTGNDLPWQHFMVFGK